MMYIDRSDFEKFKNTLILMLNEVTEGLIDDIFLETMKKVKLDVARGLTKVKRGPGFYEIKQSGFVFIREGFKKPGIYKKMIEEE